MTRQKYGIHLLIYFPTYEFLNIFFTRIRQMNMIIEYGHWFPFLNG